MVIEEVNVLQTQLEIEKSCRENAEALATKVLDQLFYIIDFIKEIVHPNIKDHSLQPCLYDCEYIHCLILYNKSINSIHAGTPEIIKQY